MKKKPSSLPRLTRPTTAYNLLSKVCKLITEEPRRYNQEDFVLTDEAHIRRVIHADPPACGTVCCVAGWIDALQRGRVREACWVQAAASAALGMNSGEVSELFDASAIDYLAGRNTSSERGTPEYAALGVKHIKAFQAKYADRLKAKRVEPIRPVAKQSERLLGTGI